ncbi:MAG: PKD domain-containing protein [Planctomycetales bacterium]|nr:PKD domain-containing protein [Planctomycetales bacterium]
MIAGGAFVSDIVAPIQAANRSGPVGPTLELASGGFIFELDAQTGLPPGFEPNDPPVADAGAAQNGSEDATISFDASASSDPENDTLTFLWDFGDGQTAQTNSPTINHAYAYGSTFLVTLTVQDGHGNQAVDATSATIAEVNDVPSADIGSGYSSLVNQLIHLDASGSSDFDNQDGTAVNDHVLTYNWDFGDGTSATTNVTAVDHVYALAGSYTASLVIDDGIVSSLASQTTVAISATPVDNSNKLYVYDIRFESRKAGKEWRTVFEIRRDSDPNSTSGDAGVAGVSITVTFAGSTHTGTTDASGVFRTDWMSLTKGNGYYANVVALTHSLFNWSLYDNVDDLEDDSDGDGLPDGYLLI